MTCEDCDRLLGDYVDGALPAPVLNDVDVHLAHCPRCFAVATDCGTVRMLAGSLEPQLPPARVWHTLAAATRAPRVRPSLYSLVAAWQPAAAAAVLVTCVMGLSWLGDRLSLVNAPVPVSGAPAEIGDDYSHRLTEGGYTSTIARLEALTVAQRTTLDPEMVDVLATGMTVIDTAIDQSRAALAATPESEVAQDSLFQALRSKVELLQGTLGLINDMRNSAERMAAELNP
jgi:hypothetical protein